MNKSKYLKNYTPFEEIKTPLLSDSTLEFLNKYRKSNLLWYDSCDPDKLEEFENFIFAGKLLSRPLLEIDEFLEAVKNKEIKGVCDSLLSIMKDIQERREACRKRDKRRKCREAGKARNKKYESIKQKVFEYAQNLLDKSKTKYTANALADKITNAYLLGNIPEISFDAENPKPTIYNWLKNEFPYFKTMKKNNNNVNIIRTTQNIIRTTL